MSIRASAWAWTVPTSPTAKLVLLALADHADEVGSCWPGVARLVEMTGLSERAIRNALGTLASEGAITITRGDGRGHTSRYRLQITAQRVQDVPPSEENGPAERVHVVPERVQQVPERVHVVPERVQQVHPEPSITVKNRQEPPKAAPRATTVALPDWLPAGAWADWCTYRRGKTWTQRAAELSIAKLADMRREGCDPAEVINQSIANGWRGLFPVKGDARAQAGDGKLSWIHTDPIFGGRTQ